MTKKRTPTSEQEDGAPAHPPAASQGKTPDNLEVAGLEERVSALEVERDEYLEDLKRIAADFDNYRKRAARDQENLIGRAHERLMKELLPVLDDLERALGAAADHEEAKLEEGVRLVERQLQETLRREGLAEIETNGAFDPHVHEALLAQPSDKEDGHILEVLQKGYQLGDRILRPARVVIAAGSSGERSSGDNDKAAAEEQSEAGDE